MTSNCYSNKLPICIEKGTGSTLVIVSAILAIGAVSLIGIWTEVKPVVTYVAQLIS